MANVVMACGAMAELVVPSRRFDGSFAATPPPWPPGDNGALFHLFDLSLEEDVPPCAIFSTLRPIPTANAEG